MLEVPSSPTALQYKYSFLSVTQLEGEDGPMCAQLLQHFKPNLEHLVQDTTTGRGARPGTKRKVLSARVVMHQMFMCAMNCNTFHSTRIERLKPCILLCPPSKHILYNDILDMLCSNISVLMFLLNIIIK